MAAETTTLAYELRETLGRLVRRLRAEGGGLPQAQATVLGRLDRNGPASISDLAAVEGMRPQSMAQTVHDLTAAGLVSRNPDPDDGRRTVVELTDAGLASLKARRSDREGWLSDALQRELSAAERERLRETLALLARLAEAPRAR